MFRVLRSTIIIPGTPYDSNMIIPTSSEIDRTAWNRNLKPTINIKSNTSYRTIIRRVPATASTAVVLVARYKTPRSFSIPSFLSVASKTTVCTCSLFHIKFWDRRCMTWCFRWRYFLVLKMPVLQQCEYARSTRWSFERRSLGFDTTLYEQVEPTSLYKLWQVVNTPLKLSGTAPRSLVALGLSQVHAVTRDTSK